MKIKIVLALFFVFVSGKSFAQITTATNGLNNTANSNTVLLGGELTTNTSIDLGASFEFSLKKGAANYFNMLNNGNIGIGGAANANMKLSVQGTTGIVGRAYISGEDSYLQLHRNHVGSDPGLIDIISGLDGGRLMLGGGATNGFVPMITMKPDGSSYNFGIINAETQDAGTYPAVIIDSRKSTGALTTQDLFGVASYMNYKMRIAANGNMLLGSNMSDNGNRLQVDGNISGGGLLLQGQSTDPTIVNGGIIYNSATNQFKGYRNGAWKNFLMEGDASSSSSNAWSLTGNTTTTSADFIGTSTGNTQPLVFKTNGNEAFRVNASGQVVVGTQTGTSIAAATEYKLAVGGAIIAEKVKVKLQSSGWPDYVFQKGYVLPSLKEVEAFIRQNKHLPDVPSSKEVEEKGLDVGDSQAMLLKKIEEMTLYLIEINKKVEKLEKENEVLKKEKQ